VKKLIFIIFTGATILLLAASNIIINSAKTASSAVGDTWTQFENGSSAYWNKKVANNTYSGAVSDKYSHYGIPAYRMELRNTDAYVNNSLCSVIETVKPEVAADESTYKFSTLLPKGGSDDFAADPKGDLIMAQWHNTPDPGEDWTYPPLSVHLSGDGHYHLYRYWDANPMSTDEELDANGTEAVTDLGSYIDDKGIWVDWNFHVKWGWKASQDPLIEIFKNGKLIQTIKGPNTTNDKVGICQELGISDGQWTVPGNPSILTDRIIYYDNVSIQTK